MRERSFWGWGWADKLPDRRALAQQAQMMLGLRELPEPRDPPRIESISLPAPRIAAPFGSADAAERIRHTYGKAYRDLVRGFRGDFSAAPDLVARPKDERDIEQVLEWCEKHGAVAIPFGGGTSVVGGVE